jgi:neutral trehalase
MKKRLIGDLLSWGSHESKNPFHDKNFNNLQAAMLETGIDDSPMCEGVRFNPGKGMMEMHDVGLNALYIGDCLALAKMTRELGKTTDALFLSRRAKNFQENIQTLWNRENGVYQNLDLVKNKFSPRISPTSFYPLIGKSVPEEAANIMIESHLLNREEFWGEWVLPSIAKSDPAYPRQRYWKGAIWAPMNFLVYLGLRDYDFQVREELVKKSVEIFRKNWKGQGYVCENYSPIDGTCTHPKLKSSPWYTWGGLMAIMGLMEEGYYGTKVPDKQD